MNLYTNAIEPLASRCAYQFTSLDLGLLNSIFADDAAVVTPGIKKAELVCQRIDQFLEWSGLPANVSKCPRFASKEATQPSYFRSAAHSSVSAHPIPNWQEELQIPGVTDFWRLVLWCHQVRAAGSCKLPVCSSQQTGVVPPQQMPTLQEGCVTSTSLVTQHF